MWHELLRLVAYWSLCWLMQDNDSMKDNVAFHCVQMQCMASVCTTNKSRLWMKSSTCLSDLRGEPCWGMKASRQVAWPGKPSAVFQYWAASPLAPAEHASCIVGPHSTVSKDKSKPAQWEMVLAQNGIKQGVRDVPRYDFGWSVICSVDENFHSSSDICLMGLFYANLWNLSSDIWDQLSEMSADFCEHCIRCRRCHDGWPVTALLTKQLRRVKHVMLTMWLPTRVRYWQVHNAIVCLARLIGALEQLISVIVVVWWHSDYGFSFWEAPMQAVCTYLSRSLLTYLYVFLFVFTLHQSKCQNIWSLKSLKFA